MFVYGPKDAADNQNIWNAVKYQSCNGFSEAPEKEAIQWLVDGQDTATSKWNDVWNWRANYIDDTPFTTRYRVAQGVSLLPLFCKPSPLNVYSAEAPSSSPNFRNLVPSLSLCGTRESSCLLLVR
jgi:hypothetical protein